MSMLMMPVKYAGALLSLFWFRVADEDGRVPSRSELEVDWEREIGPPVAFDHQFEAVGEHRTKLDFVVETGGFLDAVFG